MMVYLTLFMISSTLGLVAASQLARYNCVRSQAGILIRPDTLRPLQFRTSNSVSFSDALRIRSSAESPRSKRLAIESSSSKGKPGDRACSAGGVAANLTCVFANRRTRRSEHVS